MISAGAIHWLGIWRENTEEKLKFPSESWNILDFHFSGQLLIFEFQTYSHRPLADIQASDFELRFKPLASWLLGPMDLDQDTQLLF